MTWSEYFIALFVLALTMVLCRVVPLFLLKGRELPERVIEALNLIPPAAFAALVANDLFSPDMLSQGLWPAAIPFVSACIVIVIAIKTKSLIWCALGGVLSYALFSFI